LSIPEINEQAATPCINSCKVRQCNFLVVLLIKAMSSVPSFLEEGTQPHLLIGEMLKVSVAILKNKGHCLILKLNSL
jgi:hypothetical protein